jgi:hypothetical protein
MMTETQKAEVLEQFQSNYIRDIEESFAQTFSENDKVRLFFINENQAFTDGRNIVVDPAIAELYADQEGLKKTEEFLGWPETVSIDPWKALKVITRAQTIHECLHILYTDFPGGAATDPQCNTKNKRKVMALISNIIEDAYIEAVGCSVYDNLETYLKFGRVWQLFATKPVEGTVSRSLNSNTAPTAPVKPQRVSEKADGPSKAVLITQYLDYMATMLLFPMVELEEPIPELRDYIDQTKQLFYDGSFAPGPDERYSYCQSIFHVILPIIPDDTEELPIQQLEVKLGGTKTHSPEAETISGEKRKGRRQTVTVRLFTDRDGTDRDNSKSFDTFLKELEEFAKEHDVAIRLIMDEGEHITHSGSSFGVSPLHKDIKVEEDHPKINPNHRKAYQNIYNKYRININSYNARFLQLLKSVSPVTEEKQLFGSGISSKHMGDPKKRYWYKKVHGMALPDLAVMLLVDGSGSMSGARKRAAMNSCVILHEVLKKQGIEHCIVEHRAGGPEPRVDVNILLDFHPRREEEKYNIMQIEAYGDNRDGLALAWAERYINTHSACEHKLIIVLSDGYPSHSYDQYHPPVSSKDTANIVRKIINRGTSVIAVSLDETEEYSTYEELKEIYPEIVACNDLNRLTGQLLTVISRQLQGK